MKSVFSFGLVILSAILFAGVNAQTKCGKREVAREHILCMGGSVSPSRENNCNEMEKLLECVVKINDICPSEEMKSAIQTVGETKTFCEAGNLAISQTECYQKAKHCTDGFHELYLGKKYAEAKKRIEPARRCLDSLTCEKTGYLGFEKGELEYALELYESDALIGKCSLTELDKCQLLVYNGLGTHTFSKCIPANEKAATKCMDDLKPHCVSEKQIHYFDHYTEFIKYTKCL